MNAPVTLHTHKHDVARGHLPAAGLGAETAAMLGLSAFVVAWVLSRNGPPVGSTTATMQTLDAAVIVTGGAHQQITFVDWAAIIALLLLCARVLKDIVFPNGVDRRTSAEPQARSFSIDAKTVSYSACQGSRTVPGGAPSPLARDVADKLDDFVSVLDFIPKSLHAAIRDGLHLDQGNQDVTKYVQAALDFVGCNTTKPRIGPIATRSPGSIHFPGGLYFVSNLHVNASMKICGEFLDNTTLFALPGTKGPMVQDKGDAAKVTIQDVMIHGGGEPGVTAGIQLGCWTTPGWSPWGTYAYLTNVECRNIPKGCGIRVKVNVCTMYNVWTAGTHDGILNVDGGVALFAYGCGAAGFTGTGIMLQQSDYWSGVEIEAPAQGATPVLLRGPATIAGITISLDNSSPTEFNSLITVAMKGVYSKNGPGWSVTGITVLAANNKGTYKNLIEVSEHVQESDRSGEDAEDISADGFTSVSNQCSVPRQHTLCTSLPEQRRDDADPTPCEAGLQVAPSVTDGFGVCSDLAVEQWFRFGAGSGNAANVPVGAMFVGENGKLAFKDHNGMVHTLYT